MQVLTGTQVKNPQSQHVYTLSRQANLKSVTHLFSFIELQLLISEQCGWKGLKGHLVQLTCFSNGETEQQRRKGSGPRSQNELETERELPPPPTHTHTHMDSFILLYVCHEIFLLGM